MLKRQQYCNRMESYLVYNNIILHNTKLNSSFYLIFMKLNAMPVNIV